LLTGILANPAMLMYIGTDKEAPGVNVTGWLYGNAGQLLLQVEGAAFIIIYNAILTYIILKVIGMIVPLRMDDATLKVGDCMSSEHFGRLAWQFKRVSGSSGLKVQAAIAC
jgi:Amt family ammonium transporter